MPSNFLYLCLFFHSSRAKLHCVNFSDYVIYPSLSLHLFLFLSCQFIAISVIQFNMWPYYINNINMTTSIGFNVLYQYLLIHNHNFSNTFISHFLQSRYSDCLSVSITSGSKCRCKTIGTVVLLSFFVLMCHIRFMINTIALLCASTYSYQDSQTPSFSHCPILFCMYWYCKTNCVLWNY